MAIAAGNGEEAARLKKRASELGASISARAQATETAGLELGLEQLRRRFQLDDEDVDILVHVAATSLDPQLGQLHTKLAATAFHPWVDVGLVIPVHHDGVGERLRARERFQPERAAERTGCSRSIAAAPRRARTCWRASSSCRRGWRG